MTRRVIALASRPPFNRGSVRMALAPMIVGMAGGAIDTTFRGATFRIHKDAHPIEYGMLLYPGYNREELDFLIGGLSVGDVAVDLGSNIGMYALTMAVAVGAPGKCIAIDPSEPFMSKLMFNAQASGLGNVICENVAVGGEEGQVRINAVENNPGTATVSEVAEGGITMRPLLDILADHGVTRIAALKADIDGFEQKALGPFFTDAPDDLLPRRVVIETIMLEAESARFIRTMTDRGYRKTGETRSNALYQYDGTPKSAPNAPPPSKGDL
jgi:FkbM family methyltransferase